MEKNLGKGFCGGWAGTPGFFVLFFFFPPRPTEAPYIWLAVCFCISIWTNNVGPRISVGFVPAPYTFREKVI